MEGGEAAEVAGYGKKGGKRGMEVDLMLGGKKRRVGWGEGGPCRQARRVDGWEEGRYFHSKSCMPMTELDWGHASDDEIDEEQCQVGNMGKC